MKYHYKNIKEMTEEEFNLLQNASKKESEFSITKKAKWNIKNGTWNSFNKYIKTQEYFKI